MRLVIGSSAGDHVRVACLELKAAPRAVRHPRRHVRQRQCNGVRLIGRLQRIESLSRGRIVNDGVRLVGNLRSSARAALDSIKEHAGSQTQDCNGLLHRYQGDLRAAKRDKDKKQRRPV